jgi:hypothetical protein
LEIETPQKGRKRPDVLQRLKNRKGTQERVVKCGLNKHLINKKLIPEIEDWIITVSKVTNRGSLIFNRMLLHCLNEQKPLPDLTDQTLYVQCLNIGVGNIRKSIPLLLETHNKYFKDFPVPEKCRGDIQAYVYAAQKYMTNFKNSLIFAFDSRQKAFIKHWCKQNQLTKEQTYSIRCAVNGWPIKTMIPEIAERFIEDQQFILGTFSPENVITKAWLGTHMETVVRYFYHILTYNEKYEDTRKFTMAPISKIGRHFLTIDARILYHMMKNVNLINRGQSTFRSMKKEQFKSVFKFEGLCNRGEFTYVIETDGISACFHFRVPIEEKEDGNRELKKSNRVIAIDPGRSNLIYGIEKLDDGTTKTYRLTRNEFYTSAGMKARIRKTAKWEKDIEAAEVVFRQHSLKTIKDSEWVKFLKDYISVYEKLWEEKTKKKWAREAFRVYCLRNKMLDKFFQKMMGKEKPIIAYGAAKFNPTNKNELSVPTTYLAKRCSIHFSTVFVDEYNTTKICHGCDTKLCPVIFDGKECRGLRWCGSTKCRTFLNRDLNAALNILRCFESATARPYSLCRNSRNETKKPERERLYLHGQGDTKVEEYS